MRKQLTDNAAYYYIMKKMIMSKEKNSMGQRKQK